MAMLLAGAFSAHGAGLGKLSVYSGIGQQLNAEVALTATPGELNSMSAKMASLDAFREAGVEYTSVMSDVRISLEKDAAGQPILKLTTVRPVTEPFLHFLVELSWTSGRMVREYTFLLDPPELLQVAKPASVVTPTKPAGKPLPAAAQPTVPTAKAAAQAAKPTVPATGEYQVKQGDNLGKIARETKPDSVSLDQMLVALFNSNQDAFSGNNMNRLRAGKILRVPSAEEASQVDPAAARKIVIGQAGEFNAYRNRLAGTVAEMPKAESVPQQQASGTIKPKVEDQAAAVVAKDKLEVSRTEPAKVTQAAATSNLEEDLIARDKALREASERIVQLEKNIENLKKLVEVKSQSGAALQQQAQSAVPAAADKPVDSPKTATPAAEQSPAKAETPKPAEPAASAAPAPPAPIAKKPVTPTPPPPEPSFMDENPEIVYGGGGLVALLLAYLGYSSARRKKAQSRSLDEERLSAAPSFGTQEPDRGTAIAATPFDSGEISIQGDFSESGLLTNEEIVDPVAEADVLMAYGRDRQAEEILLEGLNKDPSRPAIHMKLLDLYAKQENLSGYEAIAQKLHVLSNGRGADWERALAVGRTLGLAGGVFSGGEALATALKPAVDAIEPTATVEPPLAAANIAAVEAAPAPIEVSVDEEVPSLEFDLDLGTTNDTAVAAAEQAVSAAPAVEDLGLDFDFDLGTPEERQAVEAVVDQAAAADKVVLDDIDFDLDLGSPVETEVVAPGLSVAELATEPPDTPVGGLGDLRLDFDLELDQEPASEELPPSSAGVLSAQMDNPEVATKLELAQAYEEMGDLEGARELLKEVVNEGSESQQAKAREKLDQLSA